MAVRDQVLATAAEAQPERAASVTKMVVVAETALRAVVAVVTRSPTPPEPLAAVAVAVALLAVMLTPMAERAAVPPFLQVAPTTLFEVRVAQRQRGQVQAAVVVVALLAASRDVASAVAVAAVATSLEEAVELAGTMAAAAVVVPVPSTVVPLGMVALAEPESSL